MWPLINNLRTCTSGQHCVVASIDGVYLQDPASWEPTEGTHWRPLKVHNGSDLFVEKRCEQQQMACFLMEYIYI